MTTVTKRKPMNLRGIGTTVRRVPLLGASAARHIVFPAGFRYVESVRSGGVKDAHWNALGDGLVRFLQESGPVLTKLGQIMATRSEVLPPAICEKLEILYNRQPAMKRSELDRLLHEAYGLRLPFAEFEKKALAVGSVGEVHRAELINGTRVIVKIIRPGIASQIKRDTETLRTLAAFAYKLSDKSHRATLRMVQRMIEDLETGFLSELDLTGEARALEEFRKRLRASSRVYIPRAFTDLSTKNILVVEEIKGESLAKFRARDGKDAKDKKALAELALREILTQIFDHGSFHADPHAGNFLVMEDGRLALIDFGLTGEFTSQDRKKIARAVKALMNRDPDAVIKALLEFSTTPKDFDPALFKNDVVELLAQKRVSAKSLTDGASNLDQLVNDLFGITYKHHIYVPQSTTLLIKTLVTIEGVARSLDPEIKLMPVAVPVVLKSLTPKWLRLISAWR